MSLKEVGVAVAVVFAIAMSSDADAIPIVVTYEGTVISGFDESGIFGLPASDLSGQSFTATYGVETSLGLRVHDLSADYVYGGVGYNAYNPVLGVTLSIGGQSIFLSGGFGAQDSVNVGSPANDLKNRGTQVNVENAENRVVNLLFSPSIPYPANLETLYSLFGNPPPSSNNGGFFTINSNSYVAQGTFDTTFVSVTAGLAPGCVLACVIGLEGHPIPEPSTLAVLVSAMLTLFGFGVIRRKREALL